MAVALIALMVAIGGTSYAVVRLPANSVRRVNVQNNAITGAKVQDNSLTGNDVLESSLTGVTAAGLEKITFKTFTGTVAAAAALDTPGLASGSAICDAGDHVVGGGGRLDAAEAGEVLDSFPDAGGVAWTAFIANGDTLAAHQFTIYAICVPSATTG
jgi:hypothetical protein